MALTHTTKWYAVLDAKIAKLTADPPGGPATYGALIDVPGIKTIGCTTTISSKELRGDNKRLDADSVLTGIALQFAHAKVNLDALPVLLGGAVTDSGVTPAQKAQFRHLGADKPSHFKFEAQIASVDVEGGDGHIVFYKCIISGGDVVPGAAEEDYRLFSGQAETAPRIADDFWFDVVENETALAIA